MAAPSRVQSSLIPAVQGAGTTGVTLSDVVQGSSLYIFVAAKVDVAEATDPMQITYTKDGGAPVVVTPVARRGLQWEAFKAVTFARVQNVDAGDYAINITLNGDASNAYVIGAAYEIAGAGNLYPLSEGDTLRLLFSGNNASSLGPFTLPGSGTFSSNEILLLTALIFSDDPTETDVDPLPPTGHTLRHEQADLTLGKQGFAMYDATLSSNAQINPTFSSTSPNDYGRAGIMVALVNLGGTTQKKILIEHERDDDLDGTTGVTVEVFANPGEGHPWTGTKLFKVENCEWHNEDIEGTIKTVMRFDVPAVESWYTSQVTLSDEDTCVVIGGIPRPQGHPCGPGGFVAGAVGVVYEEVVE